MDWLSVTQASRIAGVSPDTIRRWCADGRLPHSRTSGGHRRIDGSTLSHLMNDGTAEFLSVTRSTKNLAAVIDNWRDQLVATRPLDETRFGDRAQLDDALVAIEGVNGRGGLLGELAGLAKEIRGLLSSDFSTPSGVHRGPWLSALDDDRPFGADGSAR